MTSLESPDFHTEIDAWLEDSAHVLNEAADTRKAIAEANSAIIERVFPMTDSDDQEPAKKKVTWSHQEPTAVTDLVEPDQNN